MRGHGLQCQNRIRPGRVVRPRRRLGTQERYLGQMLTALREGGELVSVRGPRGDYQLTRSQELITAAEVENSRRETPTPGARTTKATLSLAFSMGWPSGRTGPEQRCQRPPRSPICRWSGTACGSPRPWSTSEIPDRDARDSTHVPKNTGIPIGNRAYSWAVACRSWPVVCECLAPFCIPACAVPVITRPIDRRRHDLLSAQAPPATHAPPPGRASRSNELAAA